MSLPRLEHPTRIADRLNELSAVVKARSRASLTDANHILESILARFLNALFQWKLTNLNAEQENFPAVDLGDRARRLAVQITNQDSSDKIAHTKAKAEQHRLAADFDRVIIFFLLPKKPRYPRKFAQPTNGPSIETWDIADLLQKLTELDDLAALAKAASVLDEEMGRVSNPVAGLPERPPGPPADPRPARAPKPAPTIKPEPAQQAYPKTLARLTGHLEDRELSELLLNLGPGLLVRAANGQRVPAADLGWKRVDLLPFLRQLSAQVPALAPSLIPKLRAALGDLLIFSVDPAWTARARRHWVDSTIPYQGDPRFTATTARKTIYLIRLIVCALCDSHCAWSGLLDTRNESDHSLPDDDHLCLPALRKVLPNVLPAQTPEYVKRALVKHHNDRVFDDSPAGVTDLETLFEALRKWMETELAAGRRTYFATHESYSEKGMAETLKGQPLQLKELAVFSATNGVESAMVEQAHALVTVLHDLHAAFSLKI